QCVQHILRVLFLAVGIIPGTTLKKVSSTYQKTVDILEQWARNMNFEDVLRKPASSRKHYKICGMHFVDSCFQTAEKKKLASFADGMVTVSIQSPDVSNSQVMIPGVGIAFDESSTRTADSAIRSSMLTRNLGSTYSGSVGFLLQGYLGSACSGSIVAQCVFMMICSTYAYGGGGGGHQGGSGGGHQRGGFGGGHQGGGLGGGHQGGGLGGGQGGPPPWCPPPCCPSPWCPPPSGSGGGHQRGGLGGGHQGGGLGGGQGGGGLGGGHQGDGQQGGGHQGGGLGGGQEDGHGGGHDRHHGGYKTHGY
ncbi:hypothetical protein CBL_20098, partial [Carabus blaptoides fortunei]